MRFNIGLLTLVAGIALWFSAKRERADVPRWLPRLAIAIGTLGASTILSTRLGVAWSIASSSLSVVAIVLIATVMREILKK